MMIRENRDALSRNGSSCEESAQVLRAAMIPSCYWDQYMGREAIWQ